MIEKILDNFPFYFLIVIITASIAWTSEQRKVVTCLYWIIIILIHILIRLHKLTERENNEKN